MPAVLSPDLERVLAAHRPPFPARVPEPDEPMTAEENRAFAAWVGSPLGRGLYAAVAEHALRRAGLPRGGRVLCVAEGEGTLARALGRRRPDARVLGTDVSADMVAEALARPRPPNVAFARASAYDLGAVGPAELVVCAFSLHHLHRPAEGLREMLRAVAPGGSLYVVDLRRDVDEAHYLGHLEELAGDPALLELTARSVHAGHTTAELRALLADAAPAARDREVGPVRWGEAAAAAFGGDAPTLLPPVEHVRARIAGLWVEALVRP